MRGEREARHLKRDEFKKNRNREAENGRERKSELEAETDGGQEVREKTRSEQRGRGAECRHND